MQRAAVRGRSSRQSSAAEKTSQRVGGARMFFEYGEREMEALSKKDEALAGVIARVGKIEREVDDDLFSSVVHHIVGQQISTKAQAGIWRRMQESLDAVTPDAVLAADRQTLQSFGMSYRKVDYIREFAQKVSDGSFDLQSLWHKPDDKVIAELVRLRGVGVWTAEMILLFCMQRPDIFSFHDLAIVRGVRMLYHHSAVSKKLFETYRARFSPYGSVASLYLWAVAGGALPELTDLGAAQGEKGK